MYDTEGNEHHICIIDNWQPSAIDNPIYTSA